MSLAAASRGASSALQEGELNMWVRMIEGISGGRSDGRLWPLKGGLIEVPDGEGADLVRSVLAFPAPPPAVDPDPAVVEEDEPAVAGEAEVPEPPEAPAADDDPAPSPADPKSDWVAYAISHGASQQEAENLTKAQLQSAFGGRLL
jgi:hypothetical protein